MSIRSTGSIAKTTAQSCRRESSEASCSLELVRDRRRLVFVVVVSFFRLSTSRPAAARGERSCASGFGGVGSRDEPRGAPAVRRRSMARAIRTYPAEAVEVVKYNIGLKRGCQISTPAFVYMATQLSVPGLHAGNPEQRSLHATAPVVH